MVSPDLADAEHDSWSEARRSGQKRGAGARRTLSSGASTVGATGRARALGWLSVGLGVAELTMPRALGAVIGVQAPWTLRALGLREIAAGAAILARPDEPAFLWSRVAGDAMDLALLGAAFGARDAGRVRLTAAVALVSAITAVDVLASRELSQAARARPAVPVEISLSVGVDRPAEELYRFWRDLTNLPRFMSSVREVSPLEELPPEQARRWHWVVGGPAGPSLQWDSEITEDRPGQLIGWRSSPGALLASEGSVHFAPAPNDEGTLVRLRMRFTGKGGAATAAVARLLRQLPRQQLKGELRRFKQLIETGEIASIDGQPSGERSPMVRWMQRMVPPTKKTLSGGSAYSGSAYNGAASSAESSGAATTQLSPGWPVSPGPADAEVSQS